MNPRGQRHGWNVMTVDGFETIEDVYESINSDVPGISEINLEPIVESAPEGWYEQIIWEILIQVNDKGQIIN